MEPDTTNSGTEEKVVDMPDQSSSGDPTYLADSASDRAIEQGAGSDYVVDIPVAEAVELLEAIEQGAGSNHGSDHVVDITAAEAREPLENAQGCYRNGGREQRRYTRGRRGTAKWPKPKTSTRKKTPRPFVMVNGF